MSECEVIQVIRTNLLSRGGGKDGSPFRIVTQYWSMDGDLLWEYDPVKIRREYNKVLQDDQKIPEI